MLTLDQTFLFLFIDNSNSQANEDGKKRTISPGLFLRLILLYIVFLYVFSFLLKKHLYNFVLKYKISIPNHAQTYVYACMRANGKTIRHPNHDMDGYLPVSRSYFTPAFKITRMSRK